MFGGAIGFITAKQDTQKQEITVKLSSLEKKTECSTDFMSTVMSNTIQKFIGTLNDIGGYKTIEDMDSDIASFRLNIKEIDENIAKCGLNKTFIDLKNSHILNIEKIKIHKQNLKAFSQGKVLVSERYPRYKISKEHGWKYENGHYIAKDGENGFLPMNYISHIEK
jgi:hypothetical protein